MTEDEFKLLAYPIVFFIVGFAAILISNLFDSRSHLKPNNSSNNYHGYEGQYINQSKSSPSKLERLSLSRSVSCSSFLAECLETP